MTPTLLNFNRLPTLDEFRAFFQENDLSSAAYVDMGYDKLDGDGVEFLK